MIHVSNLAKCWNTRVSVSTRSRMRAVKILQCGQSAGKVTLLIMWNPQRLHARPCRIYNATGEDIVRSVWRHTGVISSEITHQN